jgi:regulatory protein
MGEVVPMVKDGAVSNRRRTNNNLENLLATVTKLPVTEETNEEIAANEIAKEVLLRRLSHAPRTRKELAKDLKAKQITDEVAQTALDRFEEIGLINDSLLAQNYVSSAHQRRGLGRGALRQQLRAKGVSAEVAQEAVSQISDDQEYDSALLLACKKIRSLQRDEPTKQLQKIVTLLARKGYPSNLAFRVAKQVVNELPDGLPTEVS